MNCNTTHYRANSSSVPGDPTDSFEWDLAHLGLIIAIISFAYLIALTVSWLLLSGHRPLEKHRSSELHARVSRVLQETFGSIGDNCPSFELYRRGLGNGSTAFALPFWFPTRSGKVFLGFRLVRALSDEHLRHVIAHENRHYRGWEVPLLHLSLLALTGVCAAHFLGWLNLLTTRIENISGAGFGLSLLADAFGTFWQLRSTLFFGVIGSVLVSLSTELKTDLLAAKDTGRPDVIGPALEQSLEEIQKYKKSRFLSRKFRRWGLGSLRRSLDSPWVIAGLWFVFSPFLLWWLLSHPPVLFRHNVVNYCFRDSSAS